MQVSTTTSSQSPNARSAADPRTDPKARAADPRELKILAKSVFTELKSRGFDRGEMVRFTSEVIELLTEEFREASRPAAAE